MINVIIILVLLLVIGSAIGYIVKEKKRNTRCIGCPSCSECCSNLVVPIPRDMRSANE